MERTRIALVTGAGRNIGRAVALELARAGMHVAVNARSNQAELQAVADEVRALGGESIAITGDVSDGDTVRRIVAQAASELGGIDVLVNTVGVRPRGGFLDVSPAAWDAVLATNVGSLYHAAQAVLPAMLEGGWGRIIGFSGDLAHRGIKPGGHVSASKMAVVGLVRSLANEFAAAGVTANTVVPGPIDTTPRSHDVGDQPPTPAAQSSPKSLPPVGRLGRAQEVARLCAYLASDDAGFVTGQTLHINGGTSSH